MVQQGPNTLITNYCAYTSNRNKLVDHQKLIRSSKVGACADAHLPLPLPVRFRSSAHHMINCWCPSNTCIDSHKVLRNVKFAATCCLCLASYDMTYLLSQWLCITYRWPYCFQFSLNYAIMFWNDVMSCMVNQQTLFEKVDLETLFPL